jgi:hypothetical protein
MRKRSKIPIINNTKHIKISTSTNERMGNSIWREEEIEREKCISKIMSYQCPILDVGERRGHSGYIDFIRENEIVKTTNVAKGHDNVFRFFITVRADFVYPNGYRERTFSTFFQRYYDSKKIWHCCGNDGTRMMDSDGGMNLQQFRLITNLLYNGSVELNSDTVRHTYLTCFPNGLPKTPYEPTYPIALELGYNESINPIALQMGYNESISVENDTKK